MEVFFIYIVMIDVKLDRILLINYLLHYGLTMWVSMYIIKLDEFFSYKNKLKKIHSK